MTILLPTSGTVKRKRWSEPVPAVSVPVMVSTAIVLEFSLYHVCFKPLTSSSSVLVLTLMRYCCSA
jgi:hypothetical protein